MSDVLSDRLNGLSTSAIQSLRGIRRGIEKEGLRVDRHGFIAQTPHPACLGHALTHSQITTDYSESLLELITPAFADANALIAQLRHVHQYVHGCLNDEVMWASSMPCRLDGDASIPIAEYGNSNIGRLKHVYRRGLEQRYGRVMQSIAGLHYNFSLPDEFWQQYQEQLGNGESLQDFKSAQYFSLIRNFRRNAWLLMYLFGASPAMDVSFLAGRSHKLRELDTQTLYQPYGTSLRMGDLGYHNNAQSSLKICFNHLDTYTETLYQAIHTPYPPYQDIGVMRDGEYVQINTNILQIENEYYNSIRPKRTTNRGEKPIHALRERGVEYVEVRCLDLDPFLPVGIDAHRVRFLDSFLLYCLLQESPGIGDAECLHLDDNFAKTVARGREPNLQLCLRGESVPLKQAAMYVLEQIEAIAELLDRQEGGQAHRVALQQQYDKVRQPDLTPSARVLELLSQENLSHLELSLELSRKHQTELRERPLDPDVRLALHLSAEQSFVEEQEIKDADDKSFADFLAEYVSY